MWWTSMTFGQFAKERALPLSIELLAVFGAALVLRALSVEANAITFVCTILVTALLLALACDYLRKRNFYRTLSSTVERLDKPNLICELVNRPGFAEGQVFYDTLALATKAMNDEIGSYRLSSEEYRDYVETWIHEIKTPIAAAHLVAENNPGPATRSMDGEVDRIESYVEQALFYSRSANVEKDFAIREVDLGDMVREALRRNARMLIEAQVTPKLDDLNYTVYADEKWIAFVLGQILGNAAKYRTRNSPALIEISAERHDVSLDSICTVLSIRDNGIGIPTSDVSRVFDKGFTGQNGRAFAKSTGIGLYLCQQLCIKMGLRISLESHVGEGTQVSIAFPNLKKL